MLFIKTDKAHHELQPGRRTLGQRERALLLMADGRRSVADFSQLFGDPDEAGRLVRHLVQQGYLLKPAPAPHPPPAAPPPAMPGPSANANANANANIQVAADTFDGKRSLATTRMFLFDLCERMFVRRDPPRATQFRDALREARDRDSMLATAHAMLAEIEQVAGAERADAIRQRIDKLLPAEPLH